MQRLLVGILVLVGVVLAPSTASAGVVHVHSCALPDGTPVGLVRGDASLGRPGWQYRGSATNPTANDPTPCGAGETVSIVGPTGRGRLERWSSVPAPSTRIAGYAVDRSVSHAGTPAAGTVDRPPTNYRLALDARTVESCGSAAVCSALPSIAVDGQARGRSLSVSQECRRRGGCAADAVSIRSVRLDVVDVSSPRARVRGTATSLRAPSGIRSATVTASDRGLGVRSATLLVNGSPVAGGAIETGDCVDAIPGGDLDVVTPVPCPTSVERTLSYDTAALAPGNYVAEVVVTDAGGNARRAMRRTWSVGGEVAAASTSAVDVAVSGIPLSGGVGIGVYGHRYTVSGTLRDGLGTPTPGALVTLIVGDRSRVVRTDRLGRYRLVVRLSRPLVVQALYGADAASPRSVRLRIELRPRHSVTIRRGRDGLLFSGRVSSVASNTPLVLQVRPAVAGAPYQTVTRTRTRRGGRWRVVRPVALKPGRYTFRTGVPKSSRYVDGWGRGRTVTVR